jgi:hypothetical protein
VLARVTNFFGIGLNFWSTEIILGVLGLFYGAAIWLMLRLLKIVVDDKKAVILLIFEKSKSINPANQF